MIGVVLALMRRGDRWFLQRRHPQNPVMPGQWEFPGGKIEAGETAERALARELDEEVGMALRTALPCPALKGSVALHPFLVEAEGSPRTPLAWGWFTIDELLRLPIPPLNRLLIARLIGDSEDRGPGGV